VLDRLQDGNELSKQFTKGKRKIIPQKIGKQVIALK